MATQGSWGQEQDTHQSEFFLVPGPCGRYSACSLRILYLSLGGQQTAHFTEKKTEALGGRKTEEASNLDFSFHPQSPALEKLWWSPLGCISSQEAGGESLEGEERVWEAGVWPASCLRKMKKRLGRNTTAGVLGDVTSCFLLTIYCKESQCPSGEPHPYAPAACPDSDFFDWILNVLKIRHSFLNFRLSWCLSGLCLPFSPLSLFSPPTSKAFVPWMN